jgi:hypothetical protein
MCAKQRIKLALIVLGDWSLSFYSVISLIRTDGGSAMKTTRLKLVDRTDMRPVTSNGRKANARGLLFEPETGGDLSCYILGMSETYRVREHLTEAEMDKLLAASAHDPKRDQSHQGGRRCRNIPEQ